MNMNYRNFDLKIEHTEDGYFAHAYGEPFGEARDFFHSPFLQEELDQFLRLLIDPASAEQQADQRQMAQALGERLFNAVFRHNLRTSLQSSYQLIYQERSRLRIRLQLDATPEFINLPWEYLYDPIRKEFLALSTHTPLVRHQNLMHHILPFKVTAPLRALVVIPSPGSYPPTNADRNWLNLLDTLDHLALEGKLKVERLQKPTLLDLQRRLRQNEYHILHFLGHGAFDTQTQDGLLAFEDEMGRGRLVSGQHLGSLLRDHYSLRLVILGACTSDLYAMSGRADEPVVMQNPYLGAAQSLVRRGTPAVVALQLAPSTPAALTFADNFYTAIADYTGIDEAMLETRRAMLQAEPGATWGVPTLLIRTPDGHLFESRQTNQAQAAGASTNLSRSTQYANRKN